MTDFNSEKEKKIIIKKNIDAMNLLKILEYKTKEKKLLIFSTNWCNNCKKMKKNINIFLKKWKYWDNEFEIFEINLDEIMKEEELYKKIKKIINISLIPSIIIIYKNKIIKKCFGYSEIENMFNYEYIDELL